MKNIHLISTDKPSRLYLDSKNNICITDIAMKSGNKQNIYITSDEEIKEEDYALNSYYKEFLKCNESNRISIQEHWQKIILTTDLDLIADGVQSITDEFLEWFVKNPSCEFVEVRYTVDFNSKAVIIIPKEESKYSEDEFEMQSRIINKVWDEEPKQEKLEEAAEKEYPTPTPYIVGLDIGNSMKREAFIEGAKYQAERMYSEEDMKLAFFSGCQSERTIKPRVKCWEEFIEQFKKK
jgi:hypothetical protein